MTTTDEVLEGIKNLPAAKKWANLCTDTNGKPAWGRWSVQHDAASFAEAHIAKSKKHHEKAALIRMPTGTGKTGVMAIIANYPLSGKSCLIVVPSTYLTEQVMRVLNGEYWKKVGHRPATPVPAVVFLPSNLEEHLTRQTDPTAFICTQKALADVYGEAAKYSSLKARISAILVDEGHREPATTWARAVRSLDMPTILFSATPYRNDLRMFRIGRGTDYRFAVRYEEALGSALVRGVEFHGPVSTFIKDDPRTRLPTRDADIFARELLAFYRKVLRARKPDGVSTPRVIIRCDTSSSVEAVQNAMRRAIAAAATPPCGPELVIAIHDTFAGRQSEQKFTHPPKPDAAGAEALFWIHQYKLVEGIDNSDFCCVALFEPFGNDRSLVQQIGRIIRNPSGLPNETAFVFSAAADRAEEGWAGYVAFEQTGQDIIGAEDIVHAIREAQPKWFYAASKYRSGVDFDANDYWPDIRIPASAQVYDRPSGYTSASLKELGEAINDRIQERDTTHVRTIVQDHGASQTSVTSFFWEVLQSEYFEVHGFFDVRLLVVHLYMNDRHIFYQGILALDPATLATVPEKIPIENLLSAISPKDAMLKELSLVNSDLGDMAVRRKNLGGRSLERSSASLNDHLHFVTACVCSHNGKRRYIGMSHARVTDSLTQLLSLEQYHQWADSLSTELTASTEQHASILRRFVASVRAPADAKARHLLLDLKEFGEAFGDTRNGGGVEVFEATACEVAATGEFECVLGGKDVHGTISYAGGRFTIKSDELNTLFVARAGRRSASSFLSSPEVLRVVTEDGLIYADRRFFKPLRLHGKHRLTDLEMFCEIPELGLITTGEKGIKGKIGRTSWQDGSIFQVIDTVHGVFTKNDITPDIVVCDDLGTELADFVAVDIKGKKLVLLHAKEGVGAGHVSAGDLHVVVSQAKKNLAMLDAAERLPPNQGAKWDKPWRWRKGASEKLDRIRKSPSPDWDGRKIMEHVDAMRSATDTQKEVWLVLGNMFGKKEIEQVVTSEDPVAYHWIQLLYLLHSCHASVASVGARLRILIGP